MFKRLLILLSVFLFIPINAYAQDVNISASSAVVLDASSKTVLYEKNAYTKLPMASTTKIMTCLLACESDKLNDKVTITEKMLDGTYGSLIYLAVGDEISLLDLVKGAMLASGNDAANSIAVYLAGDVKSFVKMMNDKAKKIGMNSTVFVTPSGLDAKSHSSTAYDMSLLCTYALENDCFADICKMQSANISINGETQTIYNHNKLLSYDNNFVGVKTGYTDNAGRCLVSAYDFNSNTIIAVTLNAPDDWNDHKNLVNLAKDKYKTITDEETFELDIVGAKQEKVKCVAKYSATTISQISTKAYYYPFLYAPVDEGTVVGRLEIYTNNKLLETVEITVSESVKLWETTAK